MTDQDEENEYTDEDEELECTESEEDESTLEDDEDLVIEENTPENHDGCQTR